MIFTRLGPAAPFYRALTPNWAYLPESGAGAARVGGRFNRPGVEARYLAASTEGALLEYQQESQSAGLLYRSVRDSSQVCLVLYPELAHLFTAPVHDPDGRLPRNAQSWRNY